MENESTNTQSIRDTLMLTDTQSEFDKREIAIEQVGVSDLR